MWEKIFSNKIKTICMTMDRHNRLLEDLSKILKSPTNKYRALVIMDFLFENLSININWKNIDRDVSY